MNEFNPLDPAHLSQSVAQALLRQPVQALSELKSFEGAGVYALYYKGGFAPYAPLVQSYKEGQAVPLYVGKAVPRGARRGVRSGALTEGKVLFQRLMDHAESIKAAQNLDLDDFDVRALVVSEIWIPMTESLLITHAQPFWNCQLDGFGNHNPGKERVSALKPLWDTLHPGRSWSDRMKVRKEKPEDLEELALSYWTPERLILTPWD